MEDAFHHLVSLSITQGNDPATGTVLDTAEAVQQIVDLLSEYLTACAQGAPVSQGKGS